MGKITSETFSPDALPLGREVWEFVSSPSGVYLVTEHDSMQHDEVGVSSWQYVVHRAECHHLTKHGVTAANRMSVPEAFVRAAWERCAALPILHRSPGDIFMPCPDHITLCVDCVSRWYSRGGV